MRLLPARRCQLVGFDVSRVQPQAAIGPFPEKHFVPEMCVERTCENDRILKGSEF